MSSTDEQLHYVHAGMDFIKDVFEGVNKHFDKNKAMTLTDYKFLIAKATARYESRVKDRTRTTGDSA